ncbi:MAG TPA: quinone oxidoreductase [Dongiaceae bacterium]|jgi:NADPH2:quinone reductase|nr:quinone oxidoreductase [Dongiaceae bacterium]
MMKTQAIRISKPGGPEQMEWVAVDLPEPGRHQALIRHEAVGLNFIDVYHRNGLYPLATPFVLGVEAAGIIEAVGAAVTDFAVGQRVAYVSAPGAYAERRVIDTRLLLPLPEGISSEVAASVLSKGMTAEYLIHRTYPVKKGEWVLWHAAAGGVGSIAVQWLAGLGAEVVGTVGGAAKRAGVEKLGLARIVDYSAENWVAAVRDIAPGMHVVYDGVGKATFQGSLDCLRPRGMMVCFGNASGPVDPVDPLLLSRKGSLYLTRPTLAHYVATREELTQSASALFDAIARGIIQVQIGARYPLSQAAQAHSDIQARKILGSAILLP